MRGVEYFESDDREVHRDGWTYTIDTLEEFAGDDLYLVLGADAAAGIHSWHRSEDLLRLATIAVMPRPGTGPDEVDLGVDIVWLDTPEIAVSGTGLRGRRAGGRSIRFFVRDAVYRYIVEHGLYAA